MQKILFIDERWPKSSHGAGFPRANAIVRAIDKLGYDVTVYPALYVDPGDSKEAISLELPDSIKVMAESPWGPENLANFLCKYGQDFHRIIISRPTTMRKIREILCNTPKILDLSKVIYDAEAIFAIREQQEATVLQKPMSEGDFNQRLEAELGLANGVSLITTVSEREASLLQNYTGTTTHVVSHALDQPMVPFSRRTNSAQQDAIIFIGAVHNGVGPNYDSLIWFCENVLPLLRSKDLREPLYIIGRNGAQKLATYKELGVHLVGQVLDLSPWYARAKLLIAPTRFAAGIPIKVIDAAINGVPTVITPLLAEQLQWEHMREALVCNDAITFTDSVIKLAADLNLQDQLVQKAQESCRQHFTFEILQRSLQTILESPNNTCC